jgi:hypothetical protein
MPHRIKAMFIGRCQIKSLVSESNINGINAKFATQEQNRASKEQKDNAAD